MQKDLDGALQSLAAKIAADFGLEVIGVASRSNELSECLQRHQHLSRGPQNPEMQVEPVKLGYLITLDCREVVHSDNRISANQGAVTADEFERFFSA